MKLGWYWNQWLVGVMLDKGWAIPQRWLVIVIGPLAISIPIGRVK